MCSEESPEGPYPTSDNQDLSLETVRAQVANNDDMGIEEKRTVALELADQHSVKEISDALGVGEWAVEKWVGEKSASHQSTSPITLNNIIRSVYHPGKIFNYIVSKDRLHDLNRAYYDWRNKTKFNDSGVDIFDTDWDNMIILDACRYDTFKKLSNLDGTLERCQSKASMTHEWLEANFAGERRYDLVYICANGNFFNFKDSLNAEVFKYIPLWEEKYRSRGPEDVTPPEVVTEQAIDAAAEYPNKRLLIHYIQPHHPFIGSFGQSLDQGRGMKETIEQNNLDQFSLRRAYEENTELVLSEVSSLLPHLPGKTVVTADHGEMLGERSFPLPVRAYEHPPGTYTSELVDVPWLTYYNGERKEISESAPEETIVSEESAVESHLEALGYKV